MFERPEIDLEAARDGIRQCVRASGFAADMFQIDNAELLRRCTGAQRTALTVMSALSYLFGNGLIALTPEWPEYLMMESPPELKADLERALADSIAQLERMNESVRDA